MLRRLKRSSPARAILCLAVILATATAFGLHPEPVDHGNGAAAGFSRAGVLRSGAAHQCVACLTHAASLAAPLAVSLDAPAIASDSTPLLRHLSPPRLSRTPCSGLSPPADS
jgi:hypothetical protein